MLTQFRCKNPNRRDAVRAAKDGNGVAILNGIDYLEIASADQKTLSVHFIHALPGQAGGVPPAPALSELNFVIEGGVRTKNVRVLTATSSGNVVTLTVNEEGDFSTYALRLAVSPDEDAPPDGFDPQLSEIDFSFKVECPSEFDCKPVEECPPERADEPLINYLAKDFGSFRRLMLDRMSAIMPNWNERNPADLGIALVEAVAYAADHLSYYQDAVATEAYLGTARQRISVRRHARLLDYFLDEGANARAWVSFEVEPGGGADGLLLDAGVQLLTRGATSDAVISPARLKDALDEGALVFETMRPVTLLSAHNEIRFYTWSDAECCLPRGATRATLLNDPALSLEPGDVLIFEEVRSPITGREEDSDPAHRHAVRLTRADRGTDVTPLTDPLTGLKVMNIAWSVEDALPFPLCISARIARPAGDEYIENLSIARGNVTLADHGLTIEGEDLGDISLALSGSTKRVMLGGGPVTQQGRARDWLGRPVLDEEGEPSPLDESQPATAALRTLKGDALPVAELIENGDASRPWRARRDLLGSDRFDRHFVVEVDNDGRTHLRFGDGAHGARPKPLSTFVARYRTGNGEAGNVGAGSIARVVGEGIAGIDRISNPLPATGGLAPELMYEARQNAPEAFRTQQRAVTASDYALIAERHPEVQKAAGTLRWTGSWYTVFITVDRKGGRAVDPAFKTLLRAFIERYRMAGEDIEIDGPRFVPLDIVFSICVAQGHFRSQVKAELLKLFGNADLPDGRRGFFHPDNFTFGQPVYLSQMIAAAMQLAGVLWVDAEDALTKPNRFRRWGQNSHGEYLDGKIAFGRLEIARLDNDRNAPENGRIDFLMEGGL